ncbi:MAG: hypothetical protein ACI8PZ_002204 [Myxococcota bacterium]|jgi:hypothetical protein
MRFLILILVACSADSKPVDTGSESVPGTSTTPGTSTPTGSTTPTGGTSTGTPGSADERAVRALIAGERDLGSVLAEVAWSGGFPVPTSDGGWLFVAEGGPWQLAGDVTEWAPLPMNAADGFSWIELPVAEPAGSMYKFTDGGAVWVADPVARSFTYDPLGELSFVEPPTSAWRLDRWPGLAGEGLTARDVHVYVPAGDGPWPVLYAHDGQNLFDPGAIWGGWRLQDALGGVAPMVVVGVHNTFDRFDEYTHVPDDIGYGPMGGQGDAYARLVHEQLRPRMEAAYGSTGVHGVLGSSLGGLISLHIAERYPSEYDFVASLSGTLGWGRFVLENEAMEARWLAMEPGGPVVYVDSGGDAGVDGVCRDLDGDGYFEDDPDSADNYCENRAFADALGAAGWAWDAELYHWHEPGAPHSEVAWAERVARPLGIFGAL